VRGVSGDGLRRSRKWRPAVVARNHGLGRLETLAGHYDPCCKIAARAPQEWRGRKRGPEGRKSPRWSGPRGARPPLRGAGRLASAPGLQRYCRPTGCRCTAPISAPHPHRGGSLIKARGRDRAARTNSCYPSARLCGREDLMSDKMIKTQLWPWADLRRLRRDRPGRRRIEDCTKAAGLTSERAACRATQFLQQLITKNALEARQRLNAANTEIVAAQSEVASLRPS